MESYINLGNPRPSAGYNAVLGNIPASAPPSVGSLASMVPSVSNNVKEVMTNAVASYPVFAKPYKSHFERYLHPGDLIFVHVSDKAAGASGTERRGKPCILANLPLLNYFLSKQKQPGTDFQEDFPEEFTNADNWEWLGVMRNDMQVTGGAPGAGRIYRKPQYQRLINVDVRGATRTFNYWASAKAGDTLYLRRVSLDKTMLDSGHIESAILSKKYTGATKPHHVVEQIIPSIMKPDLPDAVDSDFKTMSAFNDSEQSPLKTDENSISGGDLIKVGYCFQHIGSGERVYDRAAVMAALTFQDDRFRLPLIPLFVRT